MGAAPDLRIVSNCVGVIHGGLPALIPPGEYQLSLQHWQTRNFFGKPPTLAMYFSVVDPGEHFGAVLTRHYNVEALLGNEARNGRFKATRRDTNLLLPKMEDRA